jgi:3-dehydroquinate dehydratase-2
MKNFYIINGPNLNMLGTREPEKYGALTLDQIEEHTNKKLNNKDVTLTWWQSNSESEIIDKIHALTMVDCDALIINPAGFSHTSIAILDALEILNIPIVEVHLTNVYTREPFRHQMLTAQASSIIMGGLGIDAYYFAALTQI